MATALLGSTIRTADAFKGLFVTVGSLFLIMWPLKYRLLIWGSRIELREFLQLGVPMVAELSQIKGFRTYRSVKGGKQIGLLRKDFGGTIVFSAYLKTDDAYLQWMSQIPDLDAADEQERLRGRQKAG